MPFDLCHFSLTDMLRCGSGLRHEVKDSDSMDDSASRICQSLYESARDQSGGERQCLLVRLYKTHPFGDLPRDLQEFARSTAAEGDVLDQRTKCLTLLGTAGDLPEWNDRGAS